MILYVYCVRWLVRKCVKVGETEKNAITGNVDTINISRHVISVSLMLFSRERGEFTDKEK